MSYLPRTDDIKMERHFFVPGKCAEHVQLFMPIVARDYFLQWKGRSQYFFKTILTLLLCNKPSYQ